VLCVGTTQRMSGVQVFRQRPSPQGSEYELTTDGVAAIRAAGLSGFDPGSAVFAGQQVGRIRGARRVLYDCVDWSELRDHFAGSIATVILEACLHGGWLEQRTASRKLLVTPVGQKAFVDGLLAAR